MSMPTLVGVLGAWAAAQVGLGVFFLFAYLLTRRQAEYLTFAILCFVLALTSSGLAWGYSVDAPGAWARARDLAHAGATAAGAVNLHFVMRFAGVSRARAIALVAYAVAGFHELSLLAGIWFAPGDPLVSTGTVFGETVRHVVIQPTAIGLSAYLTTAVEVVVGYWLLLRSYRAGMREALSAWLGGTFVLVAAGNDMLLVTGTVEDTVYLLPHAFMLYAAGIASTLLLRFRLAAGELEQVESTLRETTAELRHSHAELRELQDELTTKQQLAAVGELAAAIAHEVRNPLAIIVNAIASLRRPGIREEDRAMLLGIVDEETGRLNRLVDDLLRFARPVNVQRASVVLSELAQRAVAAPGSEDRVTVVQDEDAPGQIPGDANLLRIALDNLVENACHAVQSSGTVEIALRRGEVDGQPCARIEVRDDGHGMEPDVLARALDPFFTTRPSGTGLGLPIVQRITEAHGGRMQMESQPGRGTTVSLLLPLESSDTREDVPESRRIA